MANLFKTGKLNREVVEGKEGEPGAGSPVTPGGQPSLREFGAEVVREGIPAAASLTPLGAATTAGRLLAMGAITGASYLAADNIEDVNKVYDSAKEWFEEQDWEGAALATGTGMAVDFGLNKAAPFLRQYLPRVRRWMRNRVPFVPKEKWIPRKSIEENIDLQKMIDAYKLVDPAGKRLAPTFGRLHTHEEGFIKLLEGFARSSFRGGPYIRQKEEKAVDEMLRFADNLFAENMTRMSDQEFGVFLKDMLSRKGEQNLFVSGYASGLYSVFDDVVETYPGFADGSAIRQLFVETGDDPAIRAAYGGLAKPTINETTGEARRLLPPLDQPDTWRNMSLKRLHEIVKRVNQVYPAQKDTAIRSTLLDVKRAAEAEIKKHLQNIDPKLVHQYETAAGFWRTMKKYMDGEAGEVPMRKKLIEAWVRNNLIKNPDKAARTLANPENVELLRKLRARAGFVSTTEALEAAERGAVKDTVPLMKRYWEEGILKPARFQLFKQMVDENGRITSTGLRKVVRTLRDNEGFGNILFSNRKELVEQLDKIATATKLLESNFGDASIWLQLVQGGMLTKAAMSVANPYNIRQTVRDVGGAVIINIFPKTAAKIFSNPRRVSTLLNGIQYGPRTEQYARAIMMVTALNDETQEELRKLPAGAMEFYSKMESGGGEEVSP